MKKFVCFCEWVLFFLFFVLLFFMRSKMALFLAIPPLFLSSYFLKKLPIKRFSLFLFWIAFFLRILSLFLIKVPIVDDFQTMYEASVDLVHGRLGFMNTFYFQTFSYQLGFTLYQAFLLKFFSSAFALRVFNSIFSRKSYRRCGNKIPSQEK